MKNRQIVIGLMMLYLTTPLDFISFASAASTETKQSAIKGFYEKLDVYGDFRLRYENTAKQDSFSPVEIQCQTR